MSWRVFIWWTLAAILSGDPSAAQRDKRARNQNSERLASLPLVTKVDTPHEPAPIEVHDGYVHLGFWELSRLSPPDSGRYDFYLVRVPLAFELKEEGRLVRRVMLRIKLGGSEARAHDLFPAEVFEPAERLSFFVSAEYRFQLYEDVGAQRRLGIKVEPDIRGWGRGNPLFRWGFSSRGNKGVRTGDREVYFILAVPQGLRRVEALATAEIDVGREILGMWYENSSEIGSQLLAIELPAPPSGPR